MTSSVAPHSSRSRQSIADLIDTHLERPTTSWGVSAFGAVGEFHWQADEPHCARTSPLGRASKRGALAIHMHDDVDVVAWERPYFHGAPWQQGVMFVLPEDVARLSARTEITRLEDTEDGVLFDMGLGVPNVDVCVLVNDTELESVLDRYVGSSVHDTANGAMAAIKDASPARVFRSAFATCTVYQQIASSAKGIPTPEGPHTHLRLSLMNPPRSFDAALPVPAGTLPVLEMFLAHPIRDELGSPRPFDAVAFDEFQHLIESYGPPGYAADKALVRAAMEADRPLAAGSRPRRQTARVALCQLRAMGRDEAAIERVATACGLDPAHLEVDDADGEHDGENHHGHPHRH